MHTLQAPAHAGANTMGIVSPLQFAMQPVWSDVDGCWCTRDHWVYRYNYTTGELRRVFRLPRKANSLLGRLKDVLARSWLRQRWFPVVGITNLVELPSRDVVLIYDQVFWYSAEHHHRFAVPLPCAANPGLAPPLRGGIAVHSKSHCAYFGEYLNGHDRAIRVFRIDVSRQLVEACWSFPRSEIKHIHAVHYDRFRNRLWVCTGDLDHEAAFYYTDDEFQSIHRFGGGDQSWRAIAMLFDETGMEWGMDAGKDAPADAINRIYRYDFQTVERTERAVIGNPAYSALAFEDGTALIQTSFEPGRLQDTAEETTLWFRDLDRSWRLCYSAPYQLGAIKGAGKYGHIFLPAGTAPKDQALFTPFNCPAGNYRLHFLRLNMAQREKEEGNQS
jgi:hypothetical protein